MDHQQHTQMGYHPDFLTTNFWMQECQKSHKKRLKTMKPYIDSRTNNVMNMPHLKSRLKKQMNDRHERDRIQHENRILLNRLSHVMRTKQVGWVCVCACTRRMFVHVGCALRVWHGTAVTGG